MWIHAEMRTWHDKNMQLEIKIIRITRVKVVFGLKFKNALVKDLLS